MEWYVECFLCLSKCSRFERFEQLEKVKEHLLFERQEIADAVRQMKQNDVGVFLKFVKFYL